MCTYYGVYMEKFNYSLIVNIEKSEVWAWGAIINSASGVTLNAYNSTFQGTNIHPSPHNQTNWFSTIVPSNYILWDDDEFIEVNLSANNNFVFTNCRIISIVELDEEGEIINTMQRLMDIRSPYNNNITLNKCILLPCAVDDMQRDKIIVAGASYYAPKEFWSSEEYPDPSPDFMFDTNKVIINNIDVVNDTYYCTKYLDVDIGGTPEQQEAEYNRIVQEFKQYFEDAKSVTDN